MFLTLNELYELRSKLRAARQRAIDTGHKEVSCHALHVDAEGKNYRLEFKPKGRKAVLEKYGHKVEVRDEKIFVQVPLGEHGIDYLAIDPITHKIVCTLCMEKKKGR